MTRLRLAPARQANGGFTFYLLSSVFCLLSLPREQRGDSKSSEEDEADNRIARDVVPFFDSG